MMKRIILGLVLAMLFGASAEAQTVITLGCAASSGAVCTSKGPGRTYGSWGELTNYYTNTNPSAATLTQPMQIQVYNDGVAVPSDGSLLTLTTDSTNTLTLMPAPGQGFAQSLGHLCYDASRGAAIENANGDQVAVQISAKYVTVKGMQFRSVVGNRGALIVTSASGGIANVVGNILSSYSTSEWMSQVIGGLQTVTKNVVIVENYNAGNDVKVAFDIDSWDAGTVVANNLVAIVPGMSLVPIHWLGLNLSSASNPLTVQDNIIVGFNFSTGAINGNGTSGGGYNATDQAAMGETASLNGKTGIAYSTTNFKAVNFTTPSGPSSTLDLTPTATSVFKGAGSPAPVVTTDIFGQALNMDIGPVSLSAAAGPTFDAAKMLLSF